jgi:hypothetical protein
MIVAVSGGATRAGLWGAAVLDRVLQAQQQNGPALFAVSSVSGGSLGTAGAMTLLSLESLACRAKGLPLLRARGDSPVPLAGDALGSLLGGWLLDDIPRAAFDPFAALIRWVTGHRSNGGDSAEAIEHGFEDLWSIVRPKGAAGWYPTVRAFLSPRGRRQSDPVELGAVHMERVRGRAGPKRDPTQNPQHGAHAGSGSGPTALKSPLASSSCLQTPRARQRCAGGMDRR